MANNTIVLPVTCELNREVYLVVCTLDGSPVIPETVVPSGLSDEFLKEIRWINIRFFQDMYLSAGDPCMGEMERRIHSRKVSGIPGVLKSIYRLYGFLFWTWCGNDIIAVFVRVSMYCCHIKFPVAAALP